MAFKKQAELEGDFSLRAERKGKGKKNNIGEPIGTTNTKRSSIVDL